MRDTSLPIERRADAARIVDGCEALLRAGGYDAGRPRSAGCSRDRGCVYCPATTLRRSVVNKAMCGR
jgi:hypothetical protein